MADSRGGRGGRLRPRGRRDRVPIPVRDHGRGWPDERRGGQSAAEAPPLCGWWRGRSPTASPVRPARFVSTTPTDLLPGVPAPARMLVAGKLRIPTPPRHLVARPRIEGLVAGLIERHQILLVNATPGSGKTTAVSEATRTVDRAAAWLTLSDSEVAAGRLIDYLAAAIATH